MSKPYTTSAVEAPSMPVTGLGVERQLGATLVEPMAQRARPDTQAMQAPGAAEASALDLYGTGVRQVSRRTVQRLAGRGLAVTFE